MKMPDEFGETGKVKRTSLRPNRSYELPGGPYADDLGEVEVKNLAEIERGGAGDAGVRNGR
jgi:hypothetical protein